MILTKTAQFDLKFLACVASAVFFQGEERKFEDARTKIARSDNKTAPKVVESQIISIFSFDFVIKT